MENQDNEQKQEKNKFNVINMDGEAFYKMLSVHNFVNNTNKIALKKATIEDIIKATKINRDEMEQLFLKVCTMNKQYNKDKVICEKLAIIEQKLKDEEISKEQLLELLPPSTKSQGILQVEEEFKRELQAVKKMREAYMKEIKEMKVLNKQTKEYLYDLQNNYENESREETNIVTPSPSSVDDIYNISKMAPQEEENNEENDLDEFLSQMHKAKENTNIAISAGHGEDKDITSQKQQDTKSMFECSQELPRDNEINVEASAVPQEEEEENSSFEFLKRLKDQQENNKKKSIRTDDPILKKMIEEEEEEIVSNDQDKRTNKMKNKKEMSMTKMIIMIIMIIFALGVIIVGGIKLYNQSQKLDVKVPDTNKTQTQQVPALTPPPPNGINEVDETINQLNTNENNNTVLDENAVYKVIDSITTFDELQKAIDNNQIKVADGELIVGERVYAAGDSIGKNFTYIKQYSDGQIKIYSKKEHFAKKFKIQ